MSPGRRHSRRGSRTARPVALGAVLAAALAGGLAACSGAPGGSGAPDPNALPAVSATGGPSAVEAPDAVPTRAGTGLETPLPRSAQQPALQTAAAATGRVVLVGAQHPGVECVYFEWLPQGPDVPEGAEFVVDHVRVDPAAWTPTKLTCKEDPVRCVGAALTSQPGSTSCAVALARTDGPQSTGPTGATVQLVGSVRCAAPATTEQCAAFVEELVARADDPGSALPLDDPIPADDVTPTSGG